MTTIAGMDLGYGSQVKVVRSNYLVLGHIADASSTAQAHANVLEMYNNVQTAAGAKDLIADYIIGVNDNGTSAGAEVDPTSGTNPRVIHGETLTNIPVLGPVDDVLADSSLTDLPAAADTAAEISRGYKILAVLSVGVMDFGANFVAGAAIDLLGGTGGLTQLMQSNLMVSQVGGNADVLNFTEVMGDITGAGVLNGVATLDLSDAAFNGSYVSAGNAAGTAATSFGSSGATAVVADTCGLISVVSLVQTV